MVQQVINNGNQIGDPTAETVWQSFEKAKLNFAELYAQTFEQKGFKKQFLSLSGIPAEITGELERVAYSIQRGQNYDGNNANGEPFTATEGKKFIFFTSTQVGTDQTNYGFIYRFYRIHRSGQSFGGSASAFSDITNADISPAGSWSINADGDPTLFLDFGDIGQATIESVFNQGQEAPNSGEPWLIDGERIIIAISDGVPTTWRFVGNERLDITSGLWGGDDITDPEYLEAIAADFDLLSNQPSDPVSSPTVTIHGRTYPLVKNPNNIGATLETNDYAMNVLYPGNKFAAISIYDGAAWVPQGEFEITQF